VSAADETVPYRDMLKLGITARQVDYWTRQGYLRSTEPLPGSGHRRRWPLAEQSIARFMVVLIRSGIKVEVAAEAARQAVESGVTEFTLQEGVILTWDDGVLVIAKTVGQVPA
jgi:hypothetical protein